MWDRISSYPNTRWKWVKITVLVFADPNFTGKYPLRIARETWSQSILPNFDFFIFRIFAFKLGHFKVQSLFSYATNTQAYQQKRKKSLFYEEKLLVGYLTCPRRIWILQNETLNGKFVKNLRMKGIWTQIIQKIALQHMEATCCSQFHQHFTISFSFFPKKVQTQREK